MEIKTILGKIEKTLTLNNNAEETISPAYESRDNWGFNYTTLYDNDGNPIEDKSKYQDETIFLDSELDIIYGKSILSNVIIDTKGPVIKEDLCNRVSLELPLICILYISLILY